MKSTILILCLLNFSIFASCQSKKSTPNSEKDIKSRSILLIDDTVTYQTIDNFGASDAWSCQFVGLWPENKKNEIADLLFSKELDDLGNPKGIGLSLWRFNIGAGSTEQGKQSGIRDSWRRSETFMNPDKTYDWDKLKGQVWFAQAAKKRDAEKLLIFANSPPVYLTRNGKAFTGNKNKSNIAPENYKEFGMYLADIVTGLQAKGLKVDYVSPFNEPQWDWVDGGQEGNPYWNEDIFEITQAIDSVFQYRKLKTKIDLAEAAQIDYLYETGNKKGRGDQVKTFFSPQSPYYLGNLKTMGNAISGHSYFTTSPETTRIKKRQQVVEALDQVKDIEYWMSEYCILGDNAGEIEGSKRDLGITPALYLATVIHSDLVYAEASAWHWWTAISAYNYKDGLIYIDKNEKDGNFYESKMLWAMGNYSRFIRPDYQRIYIKSSNKKSSENMLYSAYANPEKTKVVVVLVNNGQEAEEVEFSFSNKQIKKASAYTTSGFGNLKYKEVSEELINIPAQAVVTVVFEF